MSSRTGGRGDHARGAASPGAPRPAPPLPPHPPSRVHVASSDCEAIRPGPIGQPANTLSSLAFVVAAVPIDRIGRRRHQPAWRAVALATAVEGLGSVAYHGPGGRCGKAVHDAGLTALTVALAAALVTEPPGRSRRPLTAALAAGSVALHTLSRTGGPLCSCRSPLQGHAAFHVLAAAALVSAAQGR